MSAVRLSLRAAKALASEEPHPGLDAAIAELRAALAKASRASATRRTLRKPKEAKRKAKRVSRREVYAAVARRAGSRCEACGEAFASLPEMDHFFGRSRAESMEACWMLCRFCHREKTRNVPGAAWWLQHFATHCAKHGYSEAEARARKRLEWVTARGGGE